MARITAVMQSRGRLQLPEALIESMGLTNPQWLEIEKTSNGILLRPVAPPLAPAAIEAVFSAHLQPLGAGRGKDHNKYVRRWKHRSGAVIVAEQGQPNIWLSGAVFGRFPADAVSGEITRFLPGDEKIGFHSNVAATPGLKGKEVVKIRASGVEQAGAIAGAIIQQLESFP